jgi:hypothetical protein
VRFRCCSSQLGVGMAGLIGSHVRLDLMHRSASAPSMSDRISPWCGWDSSRSRTHLVDSVVTCLLRTICMTHVLACAVHGYQAGGSRFSQTKSCRWFYRLFVDTSTSAWAVLLQVVSVYGVAYANSCLWVGCWQSQVVCRWCREGHCLLSRLTQSVLADDTFILCGPRY